MSEVGREKLVREPRTVQGRAMLKFWLDGRTHPPSTARRDEFVGHIIAIENAVLRPATETVASERNNPIPIASAID